jgi:ABC-type sugar transport system ATPase subunit
MAAIVLDRLTKRFDGAPVVDELSMEIADGEFAVLVGPSGCGKTTVLRMIAGLEESTSGRIRIGNRDVTDLAPRDRDVAMVFQNYALYPHLTVRENIEFGLRMRRTAGDEIARRVRQSTEMLEIGDLLERRPGQLSGGQRQRVALARAIVREPAVFLFDEPLSNLDAQVRSNTRAELVRLHRRLGATILYVTHDQVEAMTMAQRVAVMHRGRLQQVSPPLDLYHAPATLFVASFIGSPSINRLSGVVVADGDGARFDGTLSTPVRARPVGRATLAVRPEHLLLGGEQQGARAIVSLVEPLGPESLVTLHFDDGTDVVARVAGSPDVEMGSRVGVRLAPGAGLVYDEAGELVSE